MEIHANSILISVVFVGSHPVHEKKYLFPYKPELFESLYKEVLVGHPPWMCCICARKFKFDRLNAFSSRRKNLMSL
jgi:hypothetical protein